MPFRFWDRPQLGSHSIGCLSKNSHITSFAEMFFVELPRNTLPLDVTALNRLRLALTVAGGHNPVSLALHGRDLAVPETRTLRHSGTAR